MISFELYISILSSHAQAFYIHSQIIKPLSIKIKLLDFLVIHWFRSARQLRMIQRMIES